MTPNIVKILDSPSASYWLKAALVMALERDPVDAWADAQALTNVLRERCDVALEQYEHLLQNDLLGDSDHV